MITTLEIGVATGFTFPTTQAFFQHACVPAMEGMFADPVYGGNKRFLRNWRLVGFPGAQNRSSPRPICAARKGASAHAPMIEAAGAGQGPEPGNPEPWRLGKDPRCGHRRRRRGGRPSRRRRLGKAGMQGDRETERGPPISRPRIFSSTSCRIFPAPGLAPKSQAPAGRGARTRRRAPIRSRAWNNGNQAGGGTAHYGSLSWRMHQERFPRPLAKTVRRYGAGRRSRKIPRLTDWPVSYADLEPVRRPAEPSTSLGVRRQGRQSAGQEDRAAAIRSKKAPRKREYPLPALPG